MSRGKTIVKGAFILTLANLVTRIMGFVYRIFMSKALGTHGMGVFQLIMPIYTLVFSLCASGLATVVSNCTAARKAEGGAGRIVRAAVGVSVMLSFFAGAVVFFFADKISANVLHEPSTFLALRIISLCFPFMCAGAVLRGYFYGMQKMAVPAASQVLEQTVRITLVWALCDKMLARGLNYACAMAVMGMACGEIGSFLFTLAVFMPHKKALSKYKSLSHKEALYIVLSMSLPLTLNRGTGSALSTLEHILIPQRLMLHGLTNEQAVSLFGGMCGMAAPLVMFPCSLLTALAAAIMPAISEFHAQKNKAGAAKALDRSLLFTAVLSIFACGIFITFPERICLAVYGRDDIAYILRLLGFICPFLYTQVIMSAALNGINLQLYIFKLGMLGFVISLSAVYFLIPKYGIHAYIAGWAVSAIISNRLCAYKLEKEIGEFGVNVSDIIKCVISAALVCLCARLAVKDVQNGLVPLIFISGISCGAYFLLLEILGLKLERIAGGV